MDYSAASVFVYAKACGMLSKSFAGKNAHLVFDLKSLGELWAAVFKTEIPAIPSVLLAQKIEEEAEQRFIREWISLLSNFSPPDEFFLWLLREYEIENLKEAVFYTFLQENLHENFGEKPKFLNLKDFALLKYENFPNPQKMVCGTIFSWCKDFFPKNKSEKNPFAAKKSQEFKVQEFENALDKFYVLKLWQSANKISGEAGIQLKKIVLQNISLKNVIWALRLKSFYKMNAEEIRAQLVYSNDAKMENDIFARDAIEILEKDVESYEDWKNWKWKKFLNCGKSGEIWEVDSVFFENSVRKMFFQSALKNFHKFPCSPLSLAAFFWLKQHELNCIRACAEGFRLNSEKEMALNAAGIV